MIRTVITETSAYVLDEDRGVVTRLPGGGRPPDDELVLLALLRRDGEEIPVVDVVELEVGKPMRLLLDLRGDGVLTHRLTTLVKEIRDAP